MKVSNVSAGDGSVTSPSLKKLKQARLPFQIISSDTSKTVSAPPKKRKLSEEHEESPNKIGKSSENLEEVGPQEKPVEQVVISDDESVNSESVDMTNDKILNPLVSIVGVALKRKLKKKAAPAKKKKKSHSKIKNATSGGVENGKTPTPNILIDNREVIILDELSSDVESPKYEEVKKDVSFNEVAHIIENKENIDKAVRIESPNKELSDDNCTPIEETEDNTNKSEEIVQIEDISELDNVSEDQVQNVPEENEGNIEAQGSQNSDHSDDCSKGESNAEIQCTATPQRRRVLRSSQEFRTPKSGKKEQVDGTIPAQEQSCSEKSTSSPKTPADLKKLTPKQIQKRLESLKKQQEREKEKQERDKRKQDEKDEKNRQRLEKEEQKKKEKEEKEELKRKEREEKERLKEQEKKEREEKDEAKRKDKEEKELQKKREKEAKEEERKKKELEREEEKRKKELEKEEMQSKKKKAAALFVNFFVPKEKTASSKESEEQQDEDVVKNDYLSNFSKKSDMRLAPLNRCIINAERKIYLEEHIVKQITDKGGLYISRLKENYEIGKSTKTWPREDNNDVVIVEDSLPMDSLDVVMEDSRQQTLRPKLLSFSENRRPPYWGTWRRRSTRITGRKPFGLDSNLLDYECDSDEEWEEEEPGESVGGSAAGSEDEEGENDDYDVDNEFMVPHGYLSEEEAMGEEDEQVLSPEIQKAKLKILQSEFENEMKKSTERLHPRLLGILWQKSDGSKPDSCSETLWSFINNRKILSQDDQILIQPAPLPDCEQEDSKNSEKSKKSRKIQDSMIPDLIKLIHGNTNNRGFLVHEFQIHISKTYNNETLPEGEEPKTPRTHVSKMSIAKKIKEISKWMSCPEEGTMQGKMCWFVPQDTREHFNVQPELPNTWSYALTPKRRHEASRKDVNRTPHQKPNPELSKSVTKEASTSEKKEGVFNITKFTKKMTQEERNKQFVSVNPTPSQAASEKDGTAKPGQTSEVPQVKKRVNLLFSGPIGKSLPSNGSPIDEKRKTNSGQNSKTKSVDSSKNEAHIKNTKPVSDNKKKSDVKRRVPILISVPKGQDIPKSIKTNLLTQFIKSIPVEKKSTNNSDLNQGTPMETDDCVVLSD